jgi:hypothetical protein
MIYQSIDDSYSAYHPVEINLSIDINAKGGLKVRRVAVEYCDTWLLN